MRILFDQGTPVPLRQHLTNHLVDTAFERGWSTLRNGELLDIAAHERYDLVITTDQNWRYQQHLAARQLAIIVLLSTWRVSCLEGMKKWRFDQAVSLGEVDLATPP
jgi:hypothetical protein